jgi:hypothetical protein
MVSSDGQSILYTMFAVPYGHIYQSDITAGRPELMVGNESAFRSISRPAWSGSQTD